MKIIKNKKADFASIVFIVLLIFSIAVVFFIMNHLNNEIFTEIQSNINTSDTNYTEAIRVVEEIRSVDNSVWDYAFLGIFIGTFIVLGMTAYAVRISPVFYWVYGLLSFVVLALGVALSNVWQDLANDPEFALTITRFPITNSILGSYFPTVVTGIIFFAMIFLFAKPRGQEGYY